MGLLAKKARYGRLGFQDLSKRGQKRGPKRGPRPLFWGSGQAWAGLAQMGHPGPEGPKYTLIQHSIWGLWPQQAWPGLARPGQAWPRTPIFDPLKWTLLARPGPYWPLWPIWDPSWLGWPGPGRAGPGWPRLAQAGPGWPRPYSSAHIKEALLARAGPAGPIWAHGPGWARAGPAGQGLARPGPAPTAVPI